MKITWDEDKAAENIKNHGIAFTELLDIFSDPYSVDFVDEAHSVDEETRYAIIALTAPGLIYLVYTEPEADTVRFITARRAEAWMVKEYEDNRKRL